MVETANYAAAALLLPPSGLVLLALAALLGLRHRPRLRTGVVLFSLASLVACSLPVVAYALLRSLEPPPLADASVAGAQAIVVLGGGRSRAAPEWGGATLNSATLQRVRYGARLARQTSLPVLVTGGAADGSGAGEGTLLRDVLQDELRVPVRWTDAASGTTRDNARFAADTLLPLGLRRVLLVTTGWHMRRARQEFERRGFEVVPAATAFIGARPFSVFHLVPNAESLLFTHIALRESLAGLWYRLGR